MASSDPNLVALSDEHRQVVESWLVEFDQSWDEGRLSVWVRKLPAPGDRLRLPALVEMVKIDLERRWQQGNRVRLESYLEALRELGTPATVPADLILAEYEVRCQFGDPQDLSAFAERFPGRVEELQMLVKQGQQDDRDPELARPRKVSVPPNVPTPLPGGSAAAVSPLPEQFGRYRIVKKLGEGGMGAVYLAHDTQLDRLVALKVPNLKTDDSPDLLERFSREARAAATIDHPNICPVYDVGEINGIHYLTMAYVEGKSLAVFLDSENPPRRVAKLIHKLALALDEAHRKGVIHRDLKPANIMINQRNEPVIMDFGLARRIDKGDNRLTEPGAIVGSPAYMSPEQASGDILAIGPSSDIYGLGVIMYELLTGNLPFQGNLVQVLYQIANHEPDPPSVCRADLDPRIEAICLKAMAKRSEDRYRTMAEMAAALKDCLWDDSPSSHRTASSVPPSVTPSQAPRRSQVQGQSPVFDSRGKEPSPRKPLRRFWGQSILANWKIKPPTWLRIGIASAAAILIIGIIIIVRTDKGDVRIEVNDPKADIKVEVDGDTVDITGLEPLHFKLGEHKLLVTAKDFEIEAPDTFTVRRWGNPVLKITLERKPPAQLKPKRQSPDSAIQNSIGLDLVLIPPGKFPMGSPDGDDQAEGDEKPQHEVEITKAFYLGKYEVTRGQFRKFVEDTGYKTEAEKDGKGVYGYDAKSNSFKMLSTKYSWRIAGFAQTDEHPVVNVSWNDAVAFCDWLSNKEGKKYRLPTEAEWEYSCRAGTQTRYYSGDDSETLALVGNVADASAKRKFPSWTTIRNDDGYDFTAPVGCFKPNPFGLYDMHGNVWEWCQDWYDVAYYKNSPKQDPQGPSAGSYRLIRGGSFSLSPRYCRAADHRRRLPAHRSDSVGFRVVCVVDPLSPAEAKPPTAPAGAQGDGFVPLFNGKDLSGWEGLREFWSAQNGTIVGSTFPDGLRNFSTYLCSEKSYKDFELRFRVRLKGHQANSGLQIRSEIIDRTSFKVKGPQCDMGQNYWGSLYGEGTGKGMMKEAHQRIVANVLKPDDFNDFFVRCVGNHVTIKLNGVTTVDDDFPALPEEGILAFQIHRGGPMEAVFKDIEIKELSSVTQAVAPVQSGGAWVPLFNGKDLTNFYTYLGAPKNGDKSYGKNNDPEKVFTVHDGMIHVSGKVYGGLITEKEYHNYHLVVEFKWGEKTWLPREDKARDSGIHLHCVGEDGAVGGYWMESIECQMIEGGTGDIILVGGKRQPSLTVTAMQMPTGEVNRKEYYFERGATPQPFSKGRINWFGRDSLWKDVKGFRGSRDVEHPVGQWNKLECLCKGDTLTYVLNGVTVNAATNSSHTRGKILFQSEGAEVFFRKIEIEQLPLPGR